MEFDTTLFLKSFIVLYSAFFNGYCNKMEETLKYNLRRFREKQLNFTFFQDDREGRFLLRRIDDTNRMIPPAPGSSTGSGVGVNSEEQHPEEFKRKLSKREKKQLKKQEKLNKLKGEQKENNAHEGGVAEKLYTGEI